MRTMKMLLISTLILPLSFSAIAQHKGGNKGDMKERKEKVKVMKISYITEKLALTSEEAEKFWPIYNKHEDDKLALRKNIKEDFDRKKKIDEMTDEEVNKMVNAGIELREKELALHKVYISDLKKVLSIKKIAKLNLAEKNFKKELLKKIKKGGPNPSNTPPPPPPNK